jgi:hypothetical protein
MTHLQLQQLERCSNSEVWKSSLQQRWCLVLAWHKAAGCS